MHTEVGRTCIREESLNTDDHAFIAVGETGSTPPSIANAATMSTSLYSLLDFPLCVCQVEGLHTIARACVGLGIEPT